MLILQSETHHQVDTRKHTRKVIRLIGNPLIMYLSDSTLKLLSTIQVPSLIQSKACLMLKIIDQRRNRDTAHLLLHPTTKININMGNNKEPPTWRERIVRKNRTAATTRYFSLLCISNKTLSATLLRRKLHLQPEKRRHN